MDDLERENKILIERYKVLPEDLKEIIEFGLLDKVIATVRNDHHLNEDQAILLENHLMLILLLILPSYDITDKLKEILGVDEFRASLIANYLKTDLFDLVEDILEVTDEKFLLNNASSTVAPNPVASSEPATTIATPKIESLSQFRTMESDAKKIHGYGAFRGADPVEEDQPVYRSEQAKLVPPPTYSDDSSTPKT